MSKKSKKNYPAEFRAKAVRLVNECGYGVACSPNTVHADDKRLGIKIVTQRRFRVRTTDSNHNLPVAKNVLARDFKAEKPNESV